jgi:2,3-bisphosphoglycerate-dependent phosphoglycerate mutase
MPPEQFSGAGPGRLIALRHGRSAWNVDGRFTGRVDVDLAAEGRIEAAEAAEALRWAEVRPDLVVSSSLRRTRQTAEILVAACGWPDVPVQSEPDLDERDHGVLEGHTLAEAATRFGIDAVRGWRRSAHGGPPSGETFDQVLSRVRRCWTDLLEPRLDRGATVLVVGHGTSMRALLAVALGTPAETAARIEIPTGVPAEILGDAGRRRLDDAWPSLVRGSPCGA